MRWVSLAVIACALGIAVMGQSVSALGLKVAPLEYRATLKENEVKKGFIDVSNPSAQAVNVAVSVQAFRQIDDNGGLEFYDDRQAAAGIKPDLATLELGPRQAIRLFFSADSKLLPEGDIYAAIFFTTDPKKPRNGVGQLVRVGTLLSLVNKNPSEHKAQITALSLPFVQMDDQVHGTYRVKNTGPKNSGFYPSVTVSSWPGDKPKQVESSLVFGGRERENDFMYDAGFGIHSVTVSYGDTKKSRWVLNFAPWMVVAFFMIILIIGIELMLLKKRRFKRSQSIGKNNTPTS